MDIRAIKSFWAGLWKAFALLVVCGLILQAPAGAHPEDELCGPESPMDFEMCLALQEIDRAGDPTLRKTAIAQPRSVFESLLIWIPNGLDHIIPDWQAPLVGADHVLFVMALLLGATSLRRLAIYISLFTLAHTTTLGLTAAGVLFADGAIIEPLIAATIVFVAVEGIVLKRFERWRGLVVFAFGLIHGLGFAGFFVGENVPKAYFWPALIGFNIGVELGQIATVLVALLLLWPVKAWVGMPVYKSRIVPVGLLAIGAIGLVWLVERLLYA